MSKFKVPVMDGHKMDAGTTAFVQKELEYVRKKIYETPSRNLKARKLLPISYEIPSWARSHTYKIIERFGMMKLIESYADNLPLATVGKVEVTAKVRAFGNAYEYSIDDVEASKAGGMKLSSEQGIAVRQAWEELLEKVAWVGDDAYGITGILYDTNMTIGQAPTGDWLNAATTAQEIYDDAVACLQQVFDATSGRHEATHLLLPATRWSVFKNTIMYDNKTIMTVFKENNENVTLDYIPELDSMEPRPSGLGGASNNLFAYIKDSSYVELEIPREFEQRAPQAKNLAFLTNCWAKTAGTTRRFPLTMAMLENI